MTVIDPETQPGPRPTDFQFQITLKGGLAGCLAVYDSVKADKGVHASLDASTGRGYATLMVKTSAQGRSGVRASLDRMREIVDLAEGQGILLD